MRQRSYILANPKSNSEKGSVSKEKEKRKPSELTFCYTGKCLGMQNAEVAFGFEILCLLFYASSQLWSRMRTTQLLYPLTRNCCIQTSAFNISMWLCNFARELIVDKRVCMWCMFLFWVKTPNDRVRRYDEFTYLQISFYQKYIVDVGHLSMKIQFFFFPNFRKS